MTQTNSLIFQSHPPNFSTFSRGHLHTIKLYGGYGGRRRQQKCLKQLRDALFNLFFCHEIDVGCRFALRTGYGGSYGTSIIREKKVNSALNDGTLAQRTDTCPEHKQTQITHANQIQYFRVLHIIKSVVYTACGAQNQALFWIVLIDLLVNKVKN